MHTRLHSPRQVSVGRIACVLLLWLSGSGCALPMHFAANGVTSHMAAGSMRVARATSWSILPCRSRHTDSGAVSSASGRVWRTATRCPPPPLQPMLRAAPLHPMLRAAPLSTSGGPSGHPRPTSPMRASPSTSIRPSAPHQTAAHEFLSFSSIRLAQSPAETPAAMRSCSSSRTPE